MQEILGRDKSNVSILARPRGRALHLAAARNYHASRFNPRPPQRTGATGSPDVCWGRKPVSILTRPRGRALQAWLWIAFPDTAVSILARPRGRALQCCMGNHTIIHQFQSSPAPEDGR